jgi:hypothetical protein
MSKGNQLEIDFIDLVFAGTDPAHRVNASVFVSLHTADPGEAGTQLTSEAAYTGYARVGVTKGANWTRAAGQAQNTNVVTFGLCTAGSESITHFAVGSVTSGAGQIYYSGALTAPLAVSNGITPSFAALALTVTED